MPIVINAELGWIAWRTIKASSQRTAFVFRRLGNVALWRAVAVYLLVAAFAFQGYVTQSHIHFSSTPGLSGKVADRSAPQSSDSIAGDFGKQQKHDRYPPNDDPSNCPICQQIALAGSFLTAGGISPIAPSKLAFGFLISADVLVLISGVSHAWHGRGPPSI
jgi:hypothetical protein